MKSFIGAKIIEAEPMTEHEFLSKIKKVPVPVGEPNREGYFVCYPPANVGEDFYRSWSPKGVFENAYRKVTEPEALMIEDSFAGDVAEGDFEEQGKELVEEFDKAMDAEGVKKKLEKQKPLPAVINKWSERSG